MAEMDELLRVLEPWLVRVRAHVKIPLDAFVQTATLTSGLWIKWLVPDDGVLTVEDVEAMELLELFARVDLYAAWKTILEMTSNAVYLSQLVDAASLPTTARRALYPRYEIVGLDPSSTSDARFRPTIRWLLFAIDPDEHSPAYSAARRALLDCHGYEEPVAKPTGCGNDRIKLKLKVDLTDCMERVATHMLEEIADVATLTRHPERLELCTWWHHACGRRVSALSDVFFLDSTDIKFGSATISMSAFESAQRLWSLPGLNINAVDITDATLELSPRASASFFRDVLLSPSASMTPARVNASSKLTIEQSEGFFSAVQASRGLRYIFIDPNNRTTNRLAARVQARRVFFAWIAYAIFSSEASHSISEVGMDVQELTAEDVHVMQQVLQAPDPVACLSSMKTVDDGSPTTPLAERPPMIVEIAPRSLLLTAETRLELITGNCVETLRVVDDSPGRQYVSVIYPGAGVCCVHRSQISQYRELPASRTLSRAPSTLCLDISAFTDLVALTDMLKLIGRGVSHLRIRGEGSLLLGEYFFERIFDACPHVRRLDLVTAQVSSFSWLETCGSSLKELSLSDVKPQQPDGYTRMLATLSAALSGLVDLHIQLSANELGALIVDVERLLSINNTVERMLLSVHEHQRDEELLTTLGKRLHQHSGKLLAVRRAPLQLRQKLAFLGAIASGEATTVYLPLPRGKLEGGRGTASLDAVLIAMIFQFAAPCKQRLCGLVSSVMIYSDEDEDGDENESEHEDEDEN